MATVLKFISVFTLFQVYILTVFNVNMRIKCLFSYYTFESYFLIKNFLNKAIYIFPAGDKIYQVKPLYSLILQNLN